MWQLLGKVIVETNKKPLSFFCSWNSDVMAGALAAILDYVCKGHSLGLVET